MAILMHNAVSGQSFGGRAALIGFGLDQRGDLARRAATARISAAWERLGLFLLGSAVAMVLLRPGELIPELEGFALHKYLIGACLIAALGKAAAKCRVRAIRENAIMAMVLALVPAVMLSHLSHLDTLDARLGGWEMVKACALFVLLIALVDSVEKFRVILVAIGAAITAGALLTVAQHLGLLHMAALAGVLQRDPGQLGVEYLRVRGTGVFNDPNDFSLALVLGGVVCGYGLGARPEAGAWYRWRWLLLIPIGLLGYALVLTHSRGGLISAMAAMSAMLIARLGWRNAAPLGLVLGLALLLPLGGRQTHLNIADPSDTFQARLYLWGESMDLFRSSPLMGIGQGNVVDATGQVTHNSFLHAFTEMGLIGGTAFVGAFYLVVRGVWRARPRADAAKGELARLRPYVLAMVVGYAAGLLSLSRCYTVPTQLVLGLGAAYLGLAARADLSGEGARILARLDWKCLRQVAGASAVCLAGTYIFVRVMLTQVHS